MNQETICVQCATPFPRKPRKKFCSHKCAMRWHNSRQVWAERPDRELRNSRKMNRYRADPEAARRKMREWRTSHPQQQREIEKRTREKNRDKIQEAHKKWREENRELCLDIAVRTYYETRAKTPWKNIVRSRLRYALKKGIPFVLTNEWAEKRWTGRCELTDIPFVLTNSVSGFYSPSIDRIDPSKGYLPDNCRFVLFAINSFKLDGTDADILLIAKALLAKQTM